jgi:hypothetical protein
VRKQEEMRRSLKIFWVLIITSSLLAVLGGSSYLMASSSQSHSTHFDSVKGPGLPLNGSGCYVCHAAGDEQCVGQPLFADGLPLGATHVCDDCHSPEGAFPGGDPLTSLLDPDIGAKANWDGVYEEGGTTLKSGKEQWCATCHDGELYGDPAYSRRTEPGTSIVIDNSEAIFDPDGDWITYSGSAPTYGADCRYNEAGIGADTCTWTPDIPQAGNYKVYAWWIWGDLRATNAPYTINYNGGSETVRVNQKESGSGGQWNELGTEAYYFAAGTSGYVVLSDDADGVVLADAIRFERVPGIIIDNSEAIFDPDGNWSTLVGHADGYGDDVRYNEAGTGDDTCTWTPDIPQAGNYKVYAWWIWGDLRATNAPYTINYDGGSETVRVNQKEAGTAGQWNQLGTEAYYFAAGTSGYVVLSDDADGVVLADAIRFEPAGIIVDNPDATVYPDDVNWSTLVGHADGYGDDLRYKAQGTGSATVTWTSDIPEDGNYNLYAWWITGGSRATNAPYTIYYNGGSEIIRVNQKKPGSGGKWNYLRTYNLLAGTSDVVLSDGPGADGTVVADAIKWESSDIPIPGIYAPNVIGDDAQTYGFYATGHGAHGFVECLECHDAGKTHIDHEHRTYYAASNPNNYQAGYRLAKPMKVPRPGYGSPPYPLEHLDDFALCGDCHNLYEVLGTNDQDVSHTNFWEDDGSPRNGHYYHLKMTGSIFDSDWDGVPTFPVDSRSTCMTCHNVHGPPNQAMIRHGELMSTYGTTDKVPGLNFCYLTSLPPEEVCDTGAALQDSVGSKMDWNDGGTVTENGMCTTQGCHVARRLTNRNPYLGPKVLTTKADPDPAPRDGETDVVLTAIVLDHNDNVSSVTIDLTNIGGGSTPMYDDGTNGDADPYDGIYSCETTVAEGTTRGSYSLPVQAADPDGTGTNELMLEVYDPNDVIVDNSAATVGGAWSTLVGHPDGYGSDLRYKAEGGGSATVTWTPNVSVAADYKVYAWWIEGSSRATDAPYTIHYNGGSETTVRVNQKEPGTGGQWNELTELSGPLPFAAGTSGYVVLSDDADGVVVADAIKFELQP